jgi:hypothetical protein
LGPALQKQPCSLDEQAIHQGNICYYFTVQLSPSIDNNTSEEDKVKESTGTQISWLRAMLLSKYTELLKIFWGGSCEHGNEPSGSIKCGEFLY